MDDKNMTAVIMLGMILFCVIAVIFTISQTVAFCLTGSTW